MSEPVLLVAKNNGIAVLTLNRPAKMNALSYELRRALTDELTQLQTDREIGVVILTGKGRAFCAGLDLKEMTNAERILLMMIGEYFITLLPPVPCMYQLTFDLP